MEEKRNSARLKDMLAEFLDAAGADPLKGFESWVRRHPEDEPALRELHARMLRVKARLGAETTEVGSESSAEPMTEGLERDLEILGELGRGGYGKVLRAVDPRLEREVALKVLGRDAGVSPAARRRFLDEARVLAQLDHPHIVRIHWVDNRGGEIRLVLELVRGRTLHQIVDQEGPFSAAEAARIGMDLCSALAAIHERGLIHMDIKPGNVMRGEGGRIVLLDFGFAREVVAERDDDGAPIGGTPPFMSPEHFEARTDLGPRSDIYSLGVLLYWLVAGRYPYDFENFSDLRDKVLAGRITPLLDVRPDVPREFVRIIERTMARTEAGRFGSAGELEAALREFLAGGGAAAVEAPTVAARTPGRRGLLFGAAAVLLSVAAFFVAHALGASPGFEVEAQFFRAEEEGPVLLARDAEVEVGTRLYLEVEGREPFFLYVFNEDEEGRWFRLAPRDGPELFTPNTRHRLPSTDGNWIVNTRGGAEHLFVLASPHKIPLADTLTEMIPPPAIGEGVRPGAATPNQRVSILRGIGQETASTVAAAEPQLPSLVKLFADFDQRLRPEDGVFLRHLRLSND